MSIFAKPLSELTPGDLQELLQDGAVENARLEFKSEAPNKDETLKKLSSFANTFGGFMVIGARATSADGRIEDLPGVDPVDGYKQKIVDWCFGGANPPLTVEVSDPIEIPSGNGKVCYVIHARESDVAPHFLNGRKGVWVRTDEFSSRFEARLADERELRYLLDRRKLILERRTNLLERARKRFDTYAGKLHTDRGGNRTKVGSLFELCIVPRFPTQPLCDQERLKPLIEGNLLDWRRVKFPKLRNNLFSQHESAIILDPSGEFSMLEANVWGMLFYGTRIDQDEQGDIGIHRYRFVGCVLLFVKHAGRILKALGYAGPVHIDVKLTSIRGVQWLYAPEGSWLSPKSGSELDDDVAFSLTTTTDELYDNSDDVVMQLLRLVFFSVDWPDLVDTVPSLERLVLEGYDFNYWPNPLKSVPSR